ncbi:Cyclophilin-like peptidyl-prolyl cis-trans isomerase domain [Pseudocohnilembus persalinus]|uniref:Cyclophilin-like peptidyl-prolyl cis-trans isomerase domain n=1 Tax=Pseudocohnilembus persalinus TaxID=266149 RepID=A0A0V0QV80_PSEPJ|nr:Cyclophilin-like peptidyl-prolyl cis-trans isomerase domain [Pseudocohnilembus persalinus]|eukprot:KRX05864.1 Cyclophilin-like peptidyl-prolyl cis-trans isomerase domain [Pseudocohnilembus persalinus]
MLEKKIPNYTTVKIIGQYTKSCYYQALNQVKQLQSYLQLIREKNVANGSQKVQQKVLLIQLDNPQQYNEFDYERIKSEILNSNNNNNNNCNKNQNQNNNNNQKYKLQFSQLMQSPDILVIADGKYVFTSVQDYQQQYLQEKQQLTCLENFEAQKLDGKELQNLVIESLEKSMKNSECDIGYFLIEIPSESYDNQQDTEYIPFIFELTNSKTCPLTCKNFFELVKGSTLNSNSERLTYQYSSLNRNNRGFLQGGQLNSIKGEKCIFKQKYFKDECFNMLNDQPGILSMCNQNISHTNDCQFLISLEPMKYLHKKNVSFGKIIYGFEELQKIAQQFREYYYGEQKIQWRIVACGEYKFNANDWFWNDRTKQACLKLDLSQVQEQPEKPEITILDGNNDNNEFIIDICGEQMETTVTHIIEKIENIQDKQQENLSTIIQIQQLKNFNDILEQLSKINTIIMENALLNYHQNQQQDQEEIDNIDQVYLSKIPQLRYFDENEYFKKVERLIEIQKNEEISQFTTQVVEFNHSQRIIIIEFGEINLTQYLEELKEKGEKVQHQQYFSIFHFLLKICFILEKHNITPAHIQAKDIVIQKNSQNDFYQLKLMNLESYTQNNDDKSILYPEQINPFYFDFEFYKDRMNRTILSQSKFDQIQLTLYSIARIIQVVLEKDQNADILQISKIHQFLNKHESSTGIKFQKLLKNLLSNEANNSRNNSYDKLLENIKELADEKKVKLSDNFIFEDNQDVISAWQNLIVKNKEAEKIYNLEEIKNIINNNEDEDKNDLFQFQKLYEQKIEQELEQRPQNQVLKLERIQNLVKLSQVEYNLNNDAQTCFELLQKALNLFQEYNIIEQEDLQFEINYELYKFAFIISQQSEENEQILQNAIESLEKCLEIQQNKDNLDFTLLMALHLELGELLKIDNNQKQAIEQFQQNIKLQLRIFKEHRDQKPFEELGDILVEQKQIQQLKISEKSYKQAIQIIKNKLNKIENENPLSQYNQNIKKLEINKLLNELKLEEEQKYQEMQDKGEQVPDPAKKEKRIKKKMKILEKEEWDKVQPLSEQEINELENRKADLYASLREIYKKLGKIYFDIKKDYLQALEYFEQALQSEQDRITGQLEEKADLIFKKGECNLLYQNLPKQECRCVNCKTDMPKSQQEADWKCSACTKKFGAQDVYSYKCPKCKDNICHWCYEKQSSDFQKTETKPLKCEFCFKELKVNIGENFKKQKYPEWDCYKCGQHFDECRNNGYMCKCNKENEDNQGFYRVCQPCYAFGESRTRVQEALEEFQRVLEVYQDLEGTEGENVKKTQVKITYCQNLIGE